MHYITFKLSTCNTLACNNFCYFNRQYKTLSWEKSDISDNRHYPAANKEWNNSTYTYNHKHALDTPFKDEMTNRLVKSYLNLIPSPKKITKSKRMRNLIRRSTTKRLFISKPEIKQSFNKATITVYTFNREKQLVNTKLWQLFNQLQNLLNKVKSDYFHFEESYYSEETYYSTGFDLYKKRLNFYMLEKKSRLKKIFLFKFLQWTLSMFKIKVEILTPISKKGKPLIRKAKKIKINDNKLSTIFKFKRPIWANIDKNFDIINVVLLRYLFKNLKSNLFIPIKINNYIYKLFLIFRARYHNKFFKRLLKLELSAINYIVTMYIYLHKFVNYLYIIRTFLRKIYNKKIELNLVDLKYLHLNSDIYSEAIATKLKKKKSVLLKVLKNSISLVKVPIIKPIKKANNKHFLSDILISNKNYEKNNISGNKDVIDILFTEMFVKLNKVQKSRFFNKLKHVSKHTWKTNIKHVMNFLKYKWTTGVRIEAKGRLTMRFTASRAVFKYKYKGSLKNLEHLMNLKNLNLRKIDNLEKSPSVNLLRGEVRPNLQHTFIYSKKRIGAFGIKGWISNN